MRLVLVCFSLIFVLASQGELFADEGKVEALDEARVDVAVKKAVDWLKSQQKADGSWSGNQQLEAIYPYGTTALALLAILKGGEPKESETVAKALNYLKTNKFSSTYGTATLILALAALAGSEEEKDVPEGGKDLATSPVEDSEKGAAQRFKGLPSWVKALMTEAVSFLVKNKGPQIWRYPGVTVGETGQKLNANASGDQDASNTQYVMMALFEARRLGISVPQEIFVSVAEYFITNQDAEGPAVKWFPVPGADLNLSEVKDMEKRWADELNRRIKEGQKAAKKEGKEFEGIDTSTVPRDNPYDGYGGEQTDFNARGWSYLPREYVGNAAAPRDWVNSTGAMTGSGIIALMLSKLNLEKTSWYKKNGKALEKSIRDGLAWLAQNWTTAKNPGTVESCPWRYYYYYSVERASVLSLVQLIGGKNWHKEMGEVILREQQADGSWQGYPETQFAQGPTWNTCFAILFLKKATTPIIKPETIYTGEDFWEKKKKE